MQVMKSFFLFVCLVCSVSVFAQGQDPVWATIDEAVAAFDAYDADRFGAVFLDDAILIGPMGHTMNGKVTITEGHRAYFATLGEPNENIVEKITDKIVKPLGEGLVLISFINETTGDPEAEGKLNFAAVLKEVGGKWYFKSVQMTPVVPMPGN